MKERTVNAIRSLAKLTGAKCGSCIGGRGRYRCCDDTFCDLVERGLRAAGHEVPVTGHPEIRFMGENGCVIAPELRPGCSGYVCPEHLENDRSLRRDHNRLLDRCKKDPAFVNLWNAGRPSPAELEATISEAARRFGGTCND